MNYDFLRFLGIRLLLWGVLTWIAWEFNDLAGSLLFLTGIYYLGSMAGKQYQIQGLGWKLILTLAILSKIGRSLGWWYI